MSNLTNISNYTMTTLRTLSNESNRSASEVELRNTIISDSLKSETEFAIYVLFVPVFCTCGIIGNSLAMGVFLDMAKRLKHSIYIYMFSLVTVDSLTMLVFIARSLPVIIGTFDDEKREYLRLHTLIPVIYFDLVFKTINSAILILLSVERLVAIRYPFTFREMVLGKHPVLVISAACVFVSLGILPLPLCIEMKVSTELNGTEVYKLLPRENMENFMYIFVLFQTALGGYLPYVTLVCLNIGIFVQYKHVTRHQRHIFVRGTLETQLRIMVTISVIIFIYTILNLPQMFVQTLSLVDRTYSIDGSESNLFWFLCEIGNILFLVNCACDFIIYILMSSTYMERFKQRFCRAGMRS